jgi:pyruvate/2-oxoglutarate dehydrogenase complex dihydrolipoamide dehydrogenase (E3) component
MKPYDFLILGGGSAGFNAARVAVSLGLRTAIVDGARDLGGLCILRGCMPSKTLLYMADILHLAQKGTTFGLKIPSARADMKAIHARKKKIIGEFAAYREQACPEGALQVLQRMGHVTEQGRIGSAVKVCKEILPTKGQQKRVVLQN